MPGSPMAGIKTAAKLVTDLRLSKISRPSPNYDARKGLPDMIVLHYTGMTSAAAALERLCDRAAKVSAHYVIDEDGTLYHLVDEARRAWHAGVSFWAGERDINAVSIGIELVNPGHEFGYRPFPEAQISTLIALLDDVRSRWDIPDSRILGHSDVAPDRKEDPGELFPWDLLAAAGHGYVPSAPTASVEALGAPLGPGDEGLGVFVLQGGLGKLGYEILAGGPYDDQTRLAVMAFQRHFRPSKVDGIADGDTRARLTALLRLVKLEHEALV